MAMTGVAWLVSCVERLHDHQYFCSNNRYYNISIFRGILIGFLGGKVRQTFPTPFLYYVDPAGGGMHPVGVNTAEMRTIKRIFSAILHLGNVTFGQWRGARVVVVGTKLDKSEPHRLIQELGDIERLMQRVVKSVIQKVAPSCSWSASVKFVTSHSTSPSIFDFESRRVDLKGHIFDLSMEILKGYHRMMRFPKEYKDISEDIKQVCKKLEKKKLMPLFELSDQKVVTTEYKHLYGAHTNSMKQILGDVGELIYYEVKGSPWICAQPQLIASVIALFADPSRRMSQLYPAMTYLPYLVIFRGMNSPVKSFLISFWLQKW
jgi:hypothetical protein